MTEQKDQLRVSLDLFLDSIKADLDLDLDTDILIDLCGSREEIVAYLIIKTDLTNQIPEMRPDLVKTAKLTPALARPNALKDQVGNVAKAKAQDVDISNIIGNIISDSLQLSSLTGKLDMARLRVAAETSSDGPGDTLIFDRIAATDGAAASAKPLPLPAANDPRPAATNFATAQATESKLQWLRELSLASLEKPRKWTFLPLGWHLPRMMARFKRKGLFNEKAYLERYPDVVESGMDPLVHYLKHGMKEGREP